MGNNWIKERLVHTVTRRNHCKTEISNFQAISRGSCCADCEIKSPFPAPPLSFSVVVGLNTAQWCEMKCPNCHSSQSQEAVGSKVLGHLGKDNSSTEVREGKRKIKNVKGTFFLIVRVFQLRMCSHTRYHRLAHCSSLLWRTRLETMPAAAGGLRLPLLFWDAGLHRKSSQNTALQSLDLAHTPVRRWDRFQASSCLTSSEKPQLSQNESLCLCPITW